MSAHSLTQPSLATGRALRLGLALVLAAIAGCLGLVLTLAAVLGVALTPSRPISEEAYGVSALAQREIPSLYLHLYQQAAMRYHLDWAILAGIGKVECDHGRDPAPSCTHEGAVNSAGAGGPMQFLASTFSEYRVDAEGNGVPDRWNPADAIYSAANYLHAAGAPGDYRKAIFAYNHAEWYVDEVEHWASLYRGSGEPATVSRVSYGGTVTGSTAPVQYTSSERARLSPIDGHLALIPTSVPPVVQAMLMAGNELQDLPYGPAGHPDPRGAENEDCSSTVNFVLYRSGVRPIAEILRENPLAQDYVDWGAPGPGRWVTIYSTTQPTDHVFIVIAGLRLDTSYEGTDVGPNRNESGPRWRILDHIPTWAHWSVRHPPGL
ncbi:MAG TPA: lytic transglycosylase domain-containing protein [Solirubrobacteraceae bacterium]